MEPLLTLCLAAFGGQHPTTTASEAADQDFMMDLMEQMVIGKDNSARSVYTLDGRDFTETNPIIPSGEVCGAVPSPHSPLTIPCRELIAG